jgi:hypothetical protein
VLLVFTQDQPNDLSSNGDLFLVPLCNPYDRNERVESRIFTDDCGHRPLIGMPTQGRTMGVDGHNFGRTGGEGSEARSEGKGPEAETAVRNSECLCHDNIHFWWLKVAGLILGIHGQGTFHVHYCFPTTSGCPSLRKVEK